jgi:stringent starvation protein B
MISPSRPYLIRALHEWILDNDCTPYILVDALSPMVEVPREHVHDGQIVLNISPQAVRDLEVSNESITFEARFGGVPRQLYVPILFVLAIYAKENGQGMVFGHEAGAPDPNDPAPPPIAKPKLRSVPSKDEGESKTKPARSHLKVVK